MRRREFIALIGGTAAGWPLVARAQQTVTTRRIGYLSGGTEPAQRPLLAAFRRGMQGLGYIEGPNYSIDDRYVEGKFERLPSLAQELLNGKPDVLLVQSTPANLAAKAATKTVPIVMVGVADPVGVGLIANLARPGGNITGITNIGAELAGKRLEILKEVVPTASKIAVLINPSDPIARSQMDSAKAAARHLGVVLEPVLEIRSADDLNSVFRAAVRARARAGLRMIDPLESALRKQTVALAAEHRLPIIFPFREAVEFGGLMSYGTNLPDQFRQAATFVHKIFNGAKPADLPVEQPTKFELVVNLKAARALGLTIPPTLLARADEVLE
jgi:putative tryptophan/tyrosine transport system substrate-binding protein